MIESEENEVLNLPKTVLNQPTSTNGALKRYQEKLIEQYYTVFCSFQKLIKEVSDNCEQQLQQRMHKFQEETNQIKKKEEFILSTLGKSSFTFEELREQLKSLGQDLITRSLQLREDALAIYSGSYAKLSPIVDRAFESCEVFLTQLPQKYSEKLPLEIKRLNENFLQTKQKLIQVLYNIEISCRKQASNMDSEFIQRADEWKQNRFATIVEESKKQLDLSNRIDFSSIFSNFHKDQKKFTFCFRKLVSNLALFSPPEHFTESDLESWWNEVVEMTETHKNFITQFIGQFQTLIDQRNQENAQLISALEKDLFELASESEANQAMCEILPLYKQTQKYYVSLIEKLQKYWNMRTDSLFKSFESIHNFLKPLIENFQKFISEADENNQFVINETEEIRNQSQSEINQLETDLQMKSNEILVLMTEEDISSRVKECKEILANIEKSYNESYSKIISTYDTQPSLLATLFDQVEKEILNVIKMRKVSPLNDDDSSPHTTSGHSEQRRKGSSSGQRQSRKILKARNEGKSINAASLSFSASNGAKFEEIGALDLVPQFDDFIDEPQSVELTPQKGKSSKGGASAASGNAGNDRKATPTKVKRDRSNEKKPGKSGNSNKKGNKNGGYSIDDFEDVECPEFLLSDIVPKAEDGTVSIWIYIPMNEELNEWTNIFRKRLITTLSDEYDSRMKRASYAKERSKLSEELQEKMRLHAPRASAIEVNIGQKRVNQIGTRQAQLEKHFLRSVSNFNNGVENILSSVDRRKRLMVNECDKERSFIDNLATMKNATNFTVLVQNLKASEKQWEAYFAKQKGEQKKEMDNFINNFNAVNQRFMETVVLADGTFSEEEREHCKEYFSNMNAHVASIIKELEQKVSEAIDEVDKHHSDLIEEFESKLIVHKADVTFIESLKQAQMDSKNKYEALLAKNKMMENEVDRLFGLVKVNEKVDLQARLTDLFQKLDALRISVNKRGTFLSLIKSQSNVAPISFSLDLLLQQQQQQQLLQQRGSDVNLTSSNKKSRTDNKKGGADDDKKHSKVKPKGKSKSSTDKSNLNDKPNSNESQNDPSSAANAEGGAGNAAENQRSLPLKTQFDKIESDFNATVMKLSTEYYTNLKTRKMQITRPELIPEQQQDCVDKCAENWKSVTKDLQSVLSKSCLVFQTQVQNAESLSREMLKKMFAFFASFYVEQVSKDKSDIQVNFDQCMKELAKEREKHKKMMNPEMADENKVAEFRKLIEEENDRVLREMDVITNFNIQNIECEYKNMSLFTTNLPLFTNKLLNLFDRFIQIDDLSASSNVSKGIERKTMREMMKDKARKSLSNPASNDPNGRPFRLRDWPSLPAVLEPIVQANQQAVQSASQSVNVLKNIGIHFTSSSTLNNLASGNQTIFGRQLDSQISIRSNSNINASNTNLINNAASANTKKKKVTLKGAVASSLNSNTNVGGNLKLQPIDESGQKLSMAPLKSLDTSMNRGVIVERNRCYEDYEKMLSKRNDDFDNYIQSLKDETESFIKYWQTCIADLNPSLAPQIQEGDD